MNATQEARVRADLQALARLYRGSKPISVRPSLISLARAYLEPRHEVLVRYPPGADPLRRAVKGWLARIKEDR